MPAAGRRTSQHSAFLCFSCRHAVLGKHVPESASLPRRPSHGGELIAACRAQLGGFKCSNLWMLAAAVPCCTASGWVVLQQPLAG